MNAHIIRLLGLCAIVGFSVLSLLFLQFETEINSSKLPPSIKRFLSYPVFFEEQVYDARMSTLIDHSYRDERIILAAIDEKSLKKIGRFPWSRSVWVPLLEKLDKLEVKVVGFDVVFSEKEKYLEGESPDVSFANAIAKFQSKGDKKVILPYSINPFDTYDDEDLYFKEAPDHIFSHMLETKEEGEASLLQNRVMNSTYPLDTFLRAEPSLAYIGAKDDVDGVFRRYHLLTNIDGLYFPSFSLLTYQIMSGDSTNLQIKANGDGILHTKNGDIFLNVDGETKIRWMGGTTVYPVVGISEILESKDDDEELKKLFKGKTVFIGSTSFGAHDFRHTPVHNKLPGVFMHMSMVSMMLDGRYIKNNDDSFLYSWIFLIVGSIGMILIGRFENATLDTVFVALATIGVFVSDYFYFMPNGYTISVFFILVAIIGTYIWETLLDFYSASKDKAFLRHAFENYISPELIDQMYESGEVPKLGGDVGVITAYFTDIQTFSTFSEKLSVAELVTLLNEYLSKMTDILLEESGTLDKYEGDAIIAFIGAPVKFDDHASRACRVAIKMQDELLVLREKWVSEGDRWPEIVHNMRHRIGINSGEIMTGNMGSSMRMNYTMMGDSVNLAARLEEAAKQYGIFTHITQFTKDLTKEGEFEMRELDTIRVVGKSEPVTTFELLGECGKTSELLVSLKDEFHKGLEFYKNQQWDEAIEQFSRSIELEWQRWPELKGEKTNPSEVYIERCKEFKQNPPEKDWDGVYTLTAK